MSNHNSTSSFELFYSALIAKPFLNFAEAMMTAKELSLKHGLQFYQNKNQIVVSSSHKEEHELELMHKPQGWEFFLDLESRTRRLVNLCAQLCMLNAGSEDLSHYLENQLGTLLKETTAEPNQLYCPLQEELAVSTKESPKHGSLIDSFKALPKVTIPQHTLHIKTYNQSLTGDIRRAIYEHRSQPEEGHWPTSTNESWSHPHAAWPVPKPPLASSAFSLNPTQNFYMDPFPQGNPLE